MSPFGFTLNCKGNAGKRASATRFSGVGCIQLAVDLLPTLTPDEGLLLLLAGTVTLLACLGFAIWLVVR